MSNEPHPYNSHQKLEVSFEDAGGWRIEIGEKELVRKRVERWRESYVPWVEDAENYAKLVRDSSAKGTPLRLENTEKSSSEAWYDCQHAVDTIAHRGRRALDHVDALLQ